MLFDRECQIREPRRVPWALSFSSEKAQLEVERKPPLATANWNYECKCRRMNTKNSIGQRVAQVDSDPRPCCPLHSVGFLHSL